MGINFPEGTQDYPTKMGIQWAQATKTATWSTDGDSYVDVSGLSVSLTPKAATSRIMVVARIMAAPTHYVGFIRILRDSTDFYKGTDDGNRSGQSLQCFSVPSVAVHGSLNNVNTQVYIDHPNTTSSVTYKVQASGRFDNDQNGATNINYTRGDRNTSSTYDNRGISHIMIMELAN